MADSGSEKGRSGFSSPAPDSATDPRNTTGCAGGKLLRERGGRMPRASTVRAAVLWRVVNDHGRERGSAPSSPELRARAPAVSRGGTARFVRIDVDSFEHRPEDPASAP